MNNPPMRFGCFLALGHELANRETTKYSYELFLREVAPEFQGSNIRSEANISWIEAQDGRFIQSAANTWQAAKDRYEADNPK